MNFKSSPGSGTGERTNPGCVRWVSGHPVNELELGGIGMRGFFDRRLLRRFPGGMWLFPRLDFPSVLVEFIMIN